MTLRCVYSGATGAGTGADFTNAYTTLGAAITAAAAGDTYAIANDHAETAAANTTFTFKGTSANPDFIYVVNRLTMGASPASADLTTINTSTFHITVTGAVTVQFDGAFYCRGLSVSAGSGANLASFILNSNASVAQYYDECFMKLASTNASSSFLVGATNARLVDLKNSQIQIGAAGQGISVKGGIFKWWSDRELAIVPGGTTPNPLFVNTGPGGVAYVTCDGLDLSVMSGKTIWSNSIPAPQWPHIINCKLPASITLTSTPSNPAIGNVDILVSDSAGNTKVQRNHYAGVLTVETTVVPSSPSPASDGTTSMTWKVATTSNAKRITPFETFTYDEWIGTTGSPITRTFEVINDGTTLTNTDIWAEARYLGNASNPIASGVSSAPADMLAAATNLTSSGATWTTTGLTTPVTQQIAVTFTPQQAGYARVSFKVAKASKSVWINYRPNEL
jgi:hypothetical protein